MPYHAGIPDTPENRDKIREIRLQAYILSKVEEGYRTLDTIANAPISPRQAFLIKNPALREELQKNIDFLLERKELIQENGEYQACLERFISK